MNVSNTPWIRLNVLFATLLLIAGMISPVVSAQTDTAEQTSFPIYAYTCDSDPGDVSVAAGNIPGYCSATAGIWFTVATADGAFTGGCSTDGTGACSLIVPAGATVTVTEDTSTALVDTLPRANPLTMEAVTGSTGALFINLPTAPTVLPTEEVVLPTEAPVVPTEVVVLPTEPLVVPTEVVVLPTEPLVVPTEVLVLPTEQLIAPTEAPIQKVEIPTDIEFRITVYTCDRDPGNVSPAAGNIPAYCSPSATETFAVTGADGSTIGSCTTDSSGMCSLMVPNEATVTVTQDTTTLPVGTVARQNPITTQAVTEFAGAFFVNIAAQALTSDSTVTPTATATTTPTVTPTKTPTATPTKTPTATPRTTTFGTVSNTNGVSLRCRAAPSTSARIITLLPAGSRVETRGAISGGWLPVRCSGQNGWVSATYMTLSRSTVRPTPTVTPTRTPTTTPGTATFGTVSNTGGMSLRCRTAPNTSASIITLLPAGSRVEARGAISGGWLPVRCGGQNGWVSATYMTLSRSTVRPTPTVTPGKTPAPTPKPSTSRVATVSGTGGGGLRCRTAPVSGSIITVLPELGRVEVVSSAQNGWVQVRCAGQTGWAASAYLLFNVGTGSGSGQIWIDVNLSTQYMIVYQGNNVLARTYVSTGRPGFDTPTGTHYINWKLPSQTMTGTLGGEYYYVPNVPSVMYFTNRGHAIHGAYWHNNFGYRMSHGCINLPVGFASWLYNVTPTGTRVYIHY